nr:putative ribonuclease H-like domain-containing protein [Tanacetum cinerariifolium]
MSYLTDYKEIDGGYVAFGGNPKGRKITGKGTQSNVVADTKSSHDDGSKPLCDDGKKVDEDPRKESKCKVQEKKDNINSTNNVNTADVSIFNFVSDDEDDGTVADMNNLDTTIQVIPILTTRIHKDHPLDQVIGDFQSATQTRMMSKNLEEHGFELCFAFESLMYKKFQMSSIGELTFFLGLQVKQKKDGMFISKDKYVAKILKKFEFTEVKTASTPMEIQNPLLKDEDDKEVDVYMYRSMIGSLMYLTSSRPNIMFAVCAYARYQVNLKLHAQVDGKEIVIAESSVKSDLQLADGKDKDVHKELGDSVVRAATTTSSLGAECQETMRDTTAQTRVKSVSKHSNDSLLPRGNTLQSDEDSMKFNELMALCTTLQNRVLYLEKTTTTQHNEIDSLKRRVKKFEKRNRLRTHKLKRLYKVGLSARVESYRDEECLGDDASKQERRIDAIDANKDITLEPCKSTTTTIISLQKSQDKGKGIMIEEPVKPKKKDQIRLDEAAAKKLQA